MNKNNSILRKIANGVKNGRCQALLFLVLASSMGTSNAVAQQLSVSTAPTVKGAMPIVSEKTIAPVVVDAGDFEVVKIAANLFAGDVQRITGKRPAVANGITAPVMILAGTIGHCQLIDRLAASGKLKDMDQIRGHWEATLCQFVKDPFPGVTQALIIAGSDRRGTAYGLMQLSKQIGVSPWNWWADVPVPHHKQLFVSVTAPFHDEPAVKYRGIFVNDEDWGLNQWAKKNFDPAFGNIGPKTYAKIFELMLRLRLNYIWPAMHECSTEFGSVPENAALADRYGIVAGSSHCEPMLCNNIHWSEKLRGPWNYSLNRDTIYNYWQEMAKARNSEEAVWTMGIRGIHDRGMETPPTALPDRLKLVTEVFHDQQQLLDSYVTKQWGPVAKCFVPYKEVLPIYDAGLKVPDDVTLVWVDDNFGYIRRLSGPDERKRSGGSGVYWHLSYYGYPHSYTWLNTTPPALMWEELYKAWQNDARRMWVINVGDIKPMEVGIDYFSRLAWNPDAAGAGSQPMFLEKFATEQFGSVKAKEIAALLGEFYRLGTIHKPEMMNRAWALSLTDAEAAGLRRSYEMLLKADAGIFSALPQATKDAYFEMVGFPARILAASGLIFLADRDIVSGMDKQAAGEKITQFRLLIDKEVSRYNEQIAGGKWKYMMPGAVTGQDPTKWSSQVSWPWGEKMTAVLPSPKTERQWRDAAAADHISGDGKVKWVAVSGLGASGRAVVLSPATLQASWTVGDAGSPALEYRFQGKAKDGEVLIDFLPTFRIFPGMHLRVSVSVDNGDPQILEVPGSDGSEDENGPNRNQGIRNNYVRGHVPISGLSDGNHVLKIRAMDPGVVIDRISTE